MSIPPDPMARPTIYDVAHRAGVSKSLVSLVLQGSPRVSEPRRAAVLRAIADLGYRPSQAATVLASHRTRNIEVVIDDYRNLSFVGLLAGLRSEIASHGYHLTVTDIVRGTQPGQQGIGNLPARNIDGLVVAAEPDEDLLQGWTGPTVVAGWRSTTPDGADLVSSDDELGGRLAVDHLIGLGHRLIGHLTGRGGPAAHRRAGFTAQMLASGLTLQTTGQTGGTSEEDGYLAACELMANSPTVTAIFAANDSMALGALAAIRSHGRIVPGDISLIGYDNSPLAHSRYLDITSIDDRSDVVGATAGRALLGRFDDPTRTPQHTLIEPALVVRSTTAPAP